VRAKQLGPAFWNGSRRVVGEAWIIVVYKFLFAVVNMEKLFDQSEEFGIEIEK
jgi:hypothetical protein